MGETGIYLSTMTQETSTVVLEPQAGKNRSYLSILLLHNSHKDIPSPGVHRKLDQVDL